MHSIEAIIHLAHARARYQPLICLQPICNAPLTPVKILQFSCRLAVSQTYTCSTAVPLIGMTATATFGRHHSPLHRYRYRYLASPPCSPARRRPKTLTFQLTDLCPTATKAANRYLATPASSVLISQATYPPPKRRLNVGRWRS